MEGEIGLDRQVEEVTFVRGRVARDFADDVGDCVAERCPEATGLRGIEAPGRDIVPCPWAWNRSKSAGGGGGMSEKLCGTERQIHISACIYCT